MRVAAEQIASSAISSEHNHRSTPKSETMDPHPHMVNEAKWHRSALDTRGTETQIPSTPAGALELTSDRDGFVTLDEVMIHTNRILHNEDGFERGDYIKEIITEEGGSGAGRRDSLGSPSDLEKPNVFEEIMMHQNRFLHNADGFQSDDYYKEKSSAVRELLLDSEGSSIFS